MTSKIYPRTERIKQINMAFEPCHRYSNEAERADLEIYNDYKFKKHWFP